MNVKLIPRTTDKNSVGYRNIKKHTTVAVNTLNIENK